MQKVSVDKYMSLKNSGPQKIMLHWFSVTYQTLTEKNFSR